MKITSAFTRTALLLGVLLIARTTLAAGTVADAPDTDATKNPCLKYAPQDWWLMGNFDIKTLMAAMADAQGNPAQKAMIKQYLFMAKIFTGLDLENDVDYVTFFQAGDPDLKPTTLLVVKGTFEEAAVEDTLTKSLAKGMKKIELAKVPMYSNGSMAFCFPQAGTMLLGEPDLVKTAADATDKKAAFEPAVTHTLQRTDAQSVIWVALKPAKILAIKPLAQFASQHPQLFQKLSQPACISFCGLPVDDGIFLSAQASLETDTAAKALHDYLADRKTTIMTTEGINTLGLSALVMSQLETSGPYVRGSLKLTASAIQDLWNTKVILKK